MLRLLRIVAALSVVVTLLAIGCAKPQNHRVRLREYHPPPDSLLSQGMEITLDSMRSLQQAPLTDKEFQLCYVDKAWYQRFLGSAEFHPIEEYDYDILRDFPRGTVFDVVLDLPDSVRVALAKTITDSLAITNQAGFYRCFIERKKLRMLFLNGINAQAAVFFERSKDW